MNTPDKINAKEYESDSFKTRVPPTSFNVTTIPITPIVTMINLIRRKDEVIFINNLKTIELIAKTGNEYNKPIVINTKTPSNILKACYPLNTIS